MKVERYVCDTCKKTSQKHYYEEPGWVVLEGF